ncbi:MAG: hypothetical protein JXR51_08215 [Bacteroidales bacterium]|nr:hypothetical protein [Bacteroidales bacterium]
MATMLNRNREDEFDRDFDRNIDQKQMQLKFNKIKEIQEKANNSLYSSDVHEDDEEDLRELVEKEVKKDKKNYTVEELSNLYNQLSNSHISLKNHNDRRLKELESKYKNMNFLVERSIKEASEAKILVSDIKELLTKNMNDFKSKTEEKVSEVFEKHLQDFMRNSKIIKDEINNILLNIEDVISENSNDSNIELNEELLARIGKYVNSGIELRVENKVKNTMKNNKPSNTFLYTWNILTTAGLVYLMVKSFL